MTTWLEGIGVRIRADGSDVFPALERDSLTAARRIGDNLSSGTRRGLASMGRIGLTAGKALATGVAVGAAGVGVVVAREFGKAIDEASDLTESINKVNVVFGDSAGAIRSWAKQTDAIGISNAAALEAAGTYGNLLRSIGLNEGASAEYSRTLVELAADLASFNNASPEEAIEALRSGLVGETEPLKRFGVNLNEATLQAKALSSGLVQAEVDMAKVEDQQLKVAEAMAKVAEVAADEESTALDRKRAAQNVANAEAALAKTLEGKVAPLDAAAKAQAAYALILEQTALAQGDVRRSADSSLAVQRSITEARAADIRATLGKALLPGRLDTQKQINSELLPAIEDAIKANRGRLRNASGQLTDALVPAAVGAVEYAATDGIDDFERFVRWMDTTGVPALKSAGEVVRDDIWPNVKDLGVTVRDDVLPVFEEWRDILAPVAEEAVPALNTVLEGTRDLLEIIGPLVTGIFGAFNELPGDVKKAIGIGAAAAILGKRIKDMTGIGGSGGGPLGLGKGRGMTPAMPLYVLDVGAAGLAPDGDGKRRGGPGALVSNAARATGAAAVAFTVATAYMDIAETREGNKAADDPFDQVDYATIYGRVQEALGSLASEFNINLEKLARGLTPEIASDEELDYVAEVESMLNSHFDSIGDLAKGAADWLPGIDTANKEAITAYKRLNAIQGAISDRLGEQYEAAREVSNDIMSRAAALRSMLGGTLVHPLTGEHIPVTPGGGPTTSSGPGGLADLLLNPLAAPRVTEPRLSSERQRAAAGSTYAPTQHNTYAVTATLVGSVADVDRGLRDLARRSQEDL